MYEYSAIIERVLDGDTFVALVDVGFSITIKEKFRLARIDTPEVFHPSNIDEKNLGIIAKNRVIELIEGKKVTISTYKSKDKYGRYLAELILPDNSNLTNVLISEGLIKKK